ncbi:G-type lectin S-receptor-like serine/threonine-protein kinase [Canna indica]|uniref:G-type lectin S-receptor-like serine/threonine-protein kinase n=1 Tax=Canna indica TaxID=4628 RepID=A0AAQ3K2R2_9LILI|nr:G-type lectin S-receptor-like serine/threonine-protein kinase [Canna indica]
MASNSAGVPVAVIIALVVFGGIIQLVTVILIIRCVQNMRKWSVDPRVEARKDGNMWSSSTSKEESRIEMQPIEEFLDKILKEKPIRFTSQNLIDFTQNYVEKLGSGGNGTVYKGQFPNGVQIAVKILRGTSSKKAEEQFMAEIGTIGRTYHINLVKLYGFCFEESVKALVYEYMEKGSLDKYLFDQTQRIEWAKLYDIATGTAKGIRYLHEECQKKIVHYDIKPANILLTSDFLPKVADFGLAKLCERNKIKMFPIATGDGRGTPGYAAPEMWLPLPVTDKADVYSFGMLLLEMLGKRKNYDVKQAESQEWFPMWVWHKFEKGELDSITSFSGFEDEEDKKKAEKMCRVALRCIQYKPEARPTMNCVVHMFEGKELIPDVDNPFEYMMSSHGTNSSLWSSIMSTSTTAYTSTSRGTGKDGSEDYQQTQSPKSLTYDVNVKVIAAV